MASVVIGGYAADTKRTPDWLVLPWRASLGTTVLAGARFLLHHMSNLQAQASYIERERDAASCTKARKEEKEGQAKKRKTAQKDKQERARSLPQREATASILF